jgi:hypothetical protein
VQAAAAAQCGAAPAGSPLNVSTALAELQAAVRAPSTDDTKLVKAAEALNHAFRNRSTALPPGAADAGLEALAVAAAVADAAPYRGALLLERGVLLEHLARAGAALAALEAAVALLQRQALPTAEPPPPPDSAGADQRRQQRHTADLQVWVIAKLLQAARNLEELGQEEAAAAVMAPLYPAALALQQPQTYTSVIGHLNSLTGVAQGALLI